VRLRWPDAVFLLALGAVASLIGDHSHVVTGTTEYLSDGVPFVWSSPIWFPTLVAAVVGIYVTTALVHTAPAVPVNLLIYSFAAITWCVLGDRWSALCGVVAAVVGPVVEAGIAAAGLARYAEDSDALFGVAPWLPALYFAFGVVVSLLAEIATLNVDSASKAALPE
jgi:hypothetical protein